MRSDGGSEVNIDLDDGGVVILDRAHRNEGPGESADNVTGVYSTTKLYATFPARCPLTEPTDVTSRQ